jgi:hypothetical protein
MSPYDGLSTTHAFEKFSASGNYTTTLRVVKTLGEESGTSGHQTGHLPGC